MILKSLLTVLKLYSKQFDNNLSHILLKPCLKLLKNTLIFITNYIQHDQLKTDYKLISTIRCLLLSCYLYIPINLYHKSSSIYKILTQLNLNELTKVNHNSYLAFSYAQDYHLYHQDDFILDIKYDIIDDYYDLNQNQMEIYFQYIEKTSFTSTNEDYIYYWYDNFIQSNQSKNVVKDKAKMKKKKLKTKLKTHRSI